MCWFAYLSIILVSCTYDQMRAIEDIRKDIIKDVNIPDLKKIHGFVICQALFNLTYILISLTLPPSKCYTNIDLE